MAKFRKKPVVIEAIKNEGQWGPLVAWLQGLSGSDLIFQPGDQPPMTRNHDESINIPTLEGVMRAEVGDWIICGVKGKLYPCKPDIFDATYDSVTE